MLYNSARPVAPGTPFFLAPRGPFDDDTFDIHARETTMYLAARGPRVGEFETGGLAPTQIARNDSFFANLIWDVTRSVRLAVEFTVRETDYVLLNDNDGVGVHTQMQWKF